MAQPRSRPRLTRERIIAAAIDVADAEGLDALTIRTLADALGARPMALYHHVDGKDAILAAIVDAVVAEMDLPPRDLEWRAALRHRASSQRAVLRRHPWATPLLDSRHGGGPATLRQHDAVIGTLRRAGFGLPAVAAAVSLLDAYVVGFVLTEEALPFDADSAADVIPALVGALPLDDLPDLAALAEGHVLQPGYDYGAEFEIGLDIVLDGIDRRFVQASRSPAGQGATMPSTTPAIRPKLVVPSADAAIAWYRRALDAELVTRHEWDGVVVHAELRVLGTSVALKDADDVDPPTGDLILELDLPEPDPVWDAMVAAGAETVFPLEDRSYGQRAGRLRDPSGIRWIISGPLQEVQGGATPSPGS